MAALADWKNEADYPPVNDTLPARWHWEFLRRNPVYQDDYDRYRELQDSDNGAAERDALARKYGLEGIMLDYMDPLESLFQTPRRSSIRLVQWQTAWIGEDEKGVRIEGKREDMEYLDPRVRQHECCVVFNLRHDLDEQLAEANTRIKKLNERYLERRGRVENYPLYLRLLDADGQGVAMEDMMRFFMPDTEKAIAGKKLKNDLKEAKRLRDIGYQYI